MTMIQEYVDRFMDRKPLIRRRFEQSIPMSYMELVRVLVEEVIDTSLDPRVKWDSDELASKRIREIDFGDYQGTLIYVIGHPGYQPRGAWYARISYGSCSGCDTLQALMSEKRGVRLDGLMTLGLHFFQNLRDMQGSVV